LKLTLLLLTFAIVSSCSLKDKMDGSSEITPFAESKTLSDKLEGVGVRDGNSIVVNFKIPLTMNTIGHFALDDIMDAGVEGEPEVTVDESEIEKLPVKKQNIFKRMLKSFKYNVYNMALGMGISNRISYSTEYEFPDLDPEYFKEVRVKKIFFALEPCSKSEEDCQQRENDKLVNFKFLDKFFVNLSSAGVEGAKEEAKDPLLFLKEAEFEKKAKRAWGTQPLNFKSFKDKNGEIPSHVFHNLNIAKMDGAKKSRKTQRRNIRDNGNIFIARVEKNKLNHVKDMFENSYFDGIIKDITILRNSIYVELYHSQLRDKFFEILRTMTDDIRKEGVEDLTGCTNLNCANLSVNPIDLVPMLQKSKKIKIETFLSLKRLNWNDFKYSGYIELEVKLELPKI